MTDIRKNLNIYLMIVMFIVGCNSQSGNVKPFTQVIAFGDSFSDNGVVQQITRQDVKAGVPNAIMIPPDDTYWQGRPSNGPVAVEVFAQHLNVKLTDYAVGGAMSNEYNVSKIGSLTKTGMLSQVKKYITELSGKNADQDALYFIWISGNDWDGLSLELFGKYNASVADLTVAYIQTAISDLTKIGAKKFFVVNSLDASKQPDTVEKKIETYAQAYQDRFDGELPTKMDELSKQLDIAITVFDLQAVEDKIRDDPKKYGLTNLTEPCLSDIFSTYVCSNPDERYFWDPYHPTRRVHQIFGEAMAAIYGK